MRTDTTPVIDPDATSAEISDTGLLVVPPGTEVLRRVDEPAGLQAPAHSVAAEVRFSDLPKPYTTQWVYLTVQPDLVADGKTRPGVEKDGRTGIQGPASGDPNLTFTQWLFTAIEYGAPAWPYSGLASEPHLALDGTLVLPDTARLVKKIDNPLGLGGAQTSLAVAWIDPDDLVSNDEQWAVMVLDTAWRPGKDNPLKLTNGFAWQRQPSEEGTDFATWASRQRLGTFRADTPPAWVEGG